jgi:hypothetical protein
VGERRARGMAGVVRAEQWTVRRLTLQGALRFDRAASWFPAQQEGPSRFLPTPLRIPETRGVDSYTDDHAAVGHRLRRDRARHDGDQDEPRTLSRGRSA